MQNTREKTSDVCPVERTCFPRPRQCILIYLPVTTGLSVVSFLSLRPAKAWRLPSKQQLCPMFLQLSCVLTSEKRSTAYTISQIKLCELGDLKWCRHVSAKVHLGCRMERFRSTKLTSLEQGGS